MSETTGPPGTLSIERDDRPSIAVVTVRGEIDLATTPALKAAFGEALAGKPPILVVDLSGVGFLASAGLTQLVILARDMPEGTALRIVASGRAVLRPVQLTGLEHSLPLYPTMEAALAAE
ncbi:anti-anti-sigma factor [Amycolatopsis sulphurea]|uniref:Anti-sigma factor antagonist n=1 Tax=Amycolatopsis sulphurea TaxID=76022 RepID=A0A2A9G320_9PSEU|nr:STAS domain-containing protein [Amycolatopsis sulphurea]PFG57291.1 anti-anti-sigma factor [Amycolatopsis sulphurea]